MLIPLIMAALGFAIAANLGGLWLGVFVGVAGACWGAGIVRWTALQKGEAKFGWADGLGAIVSVLACVTLFIQVVNENGDAALPLLFFMLFLWPLPFGAVVLLLFPFLRQRDDYHFEPAPRREPERPVHVRIVRRVTMIGRKRG